jgi:hypothetical protein
VALLVPNYLHVLAAASFLLTLILICFPTSFRCFFNRRRMRDYRITYLPTIRSLLDAVSSISEDGSRKPKDLAWGLLLGPVICPRCGTTNRLTDVCIECGDYLGGE